jgi:hypothetical protein
LTFIIYALVLIFTGLREVHKLTFAKTLIAVLTPTAIITVFGVALLKGFQYFVQSLMP